MTEVSIQSGGTPGGAKHYYVDEAGDSVLFDAAGRVLVGHEGCSKFFVLGFLDVAHPPALNEAMAALRKRLLADPYFRRVPSMQPAARKTALAFHAKDDLPEVRRDVFALLASHEVKFHAEVYSKLSFVKWVRNTNRTSPSYRYTQNSIYDNLVARLFKNHLHKNEAYHIAFASRGKSDRTRALLGALERARRGFLKKWGVEGQGEIKVVVASPAQLACLQAADYFLWAVQRCFERRDDKYIEFLWSKVGAVHDISDHRKRKTGVYYTKDNPLGAAGLPG